MTQEVNEDVDVVAEDAADDLEWNPRIRDWREASGTYAVFSTPYPPFYAHKRVSHWALLDHPDGTSEIAGMTTQNGGIVSVFEVPTGHFIDYYRPAEMHEEEIQQILNEARQDGEARHRKMFPATQPTQRPRSFTPQPAPHSFDEDDEPVSPAPTSIAPRRRRRRH